jgi:regulator of sigma E protease
MENLLELATQFVIPFIAVISVVVFVHEFGHYWVARRCGVKIETFSIGFGHEIFGWTDKHGTRWKVSWLPLGGYVKMYGDAGPASTPDANVHKMTDAQKKVSFFHQHVDKRIAVIAAGPITNYIFAIIVLAFLFMLSGQPYTPASVSEVVEGSAAQKAGIQPGDRIVMADGQSIDRFEDIKRVVALNAGTPMDVELERGAQHVTLTLTPDIVTVKDNFGNEHRIGQIGIKSNTLERKKQAPLEAVRQAFLETWNLTTGTLKAVGQMIMGIRSTDELGGIVKIAKISGGAAKEGAVSLIWVMAVISINLGLVNLFPIPPLDGGHLVFYLAERVLGRPLHARVQDIGMQIGMMLVFSLMIFANWMDVRDKVLSYIHGAFS